MFGTKSRNKLETASFQLKVSLTQHGVVWCGELNIVRGWFSMLPWNMFYADVVQRTTLHLIERGWYLKWMLYKSYLALTLMKPDLIFVDKIFEIRHSKYFVEQGLNIWVSDWACHITHPDCVRARKYQSKHYIYTISTLVIVKNIYLYLEAPSTHEELRVDAVHNGCGVESRLHTSSLSLLTFVLLCNSVTIFLVPGASSSFSSMQ